MYIEYLEDSFINTPIPISLIETVDSATTTIGQSYSIYLPNSDSSLKVLRGEYLEIKLQNTYASKAVKTRTIQFELDQLIKNNIRKSAAGCFDVYIEISLVPNDRINPNGFDVRARFTINIEMKSRLR